MKSTVKNKMLGLSLMFLLLTQLAQADETKCTKETAEACLKTAQSFLKKNDWQTGLKILIEVCDLEISRGCLKAGIVEEKLGMKSEAKAHFKKACELDKSKECPNAKD